MPIIERLCGDCFVDTQIDQREVSIFVDLDPASRRNCANYSNMTFDRITFDLAIMGGLVHRARDVIPLTALKLAVIR
jgi:hypothetical protein